MREVTVKTATCLDESGREHRFRYVLLIGEGSRYGVRIEEAGGERAEVAELTFRHARAVKLLARLAHYAVTPINLPEVLSDWGVKVTSCEPRRSFSVPPRAGR